MELETKKELDQNAIPFCLHQLSEEERNMLSEDLINGEDFTA